MTHPALEESDLYDDPSPIPFPSVVEKATIGAAVGAVAENDEAAHPEQSANKAYLAAVNAALDILSYRLILLLSVLVAGGLFGLAGWYPDPWRLGAAVAFSGLVVMPQFFYARR